MALALSAVPNGINRYQDMKQEEQWLEAIMARDRRYDGVIYYGVTTTGIFCRPSCPSRRPLRKNLRLFRDGTAAREAGFRPCRRCRPEQVDTSEAQYVMAACRLMAGHRQGPLPVRELARQVGISERHLRELFVRHLGVSPRQFYNSLRINHLREALARGEDVTSAIYAAGFNSPSRAYTDINARLGMSPAVYRQGGKGEAIGYLLLPTSQGHILVAGTTQGLCSVQLGDAPEALLARLRQEFPRACLQTDEGVIADWAYALVAYLENQGPWPLQPIDIHTTAFQARVWKILREIPEGETLTYKAIAARLGIPAGARAVARACAANPLALVIPCHRAVREDGKDTAFRWGRQRKRALLEHERRRAKGEDGE
jgi:AraC family transcriptional regulator of adaptative response/methylated-DNA-[protein]-cysteine methyltransferase